MQMDRYKTGELIALARKEKNLTQKDLAAKLHVSDRAVSKWERGAGFPDVSLLEPLATALDLTVLDLLRGERTEETDVHAAVQEALEAVRQERQRTRRALLRAIPALLFLLLVLSVFGFLRMPVDRTESVCVYRDGAPVAVTEVYLKGSICFRPWKWTYHGRFATLWAPGSSWEGATVTLDYLPGRDRLLRVSRQLDTTKGWVRGEVELTGYCVSPLLGEFAACTETGDILATTPEMYSRFVTAHGGAELETTLFEEPDLTGNPKAQYNGGYPSHE